MKLYQLTINDRLEAYSKDDFLIKLYLSQRGKVKSNFSIKKINISKSDYIDLEMLLFYYNGFALTSREMEYISSLDEERRSYYDNQVIGLRIFLINNKTRLSKEEIRSIKNTIKLLEKKREMNEEEIISAIDTIIDAPRIVSEYMEQIKFIKQELRGEW